MGYEEQIKEHYAEIDRVKSCDKYDDAEKALLINCINNMINNTIRIIELKAEVNEIKSKR